MSLDYVLYSGVEYATSSDQFATTCGYYTQYEWQGQASVYFEVKTNAATQATGGVGVAALVMGVIALMAGIM
jgi:hypothetical protein